MGGIVISKEIQQTPLDASDIETLQKGREEIHKLRCLCHSVHPIDGELLKKLQTMTPFHEEILSQQGKSLDISDIEDLDSAKKEIIKLRSIWISLKLSESDLNSMVSLTDPKALSDNPIIATIRQNMTNETAREFFKSHDLNGSGLIERSEFRRFLRMQKVVYSEADLETFLDTYDVNNDGKLSYGEFLRAFSGNSSVIIENAQNLVTSINEKLDPSQPLESFKKSDKDSSGLVDRSEMRRLLRVNGIAYREEDFESFFTLHDHTGDGKLNFEEFCRAMGYCP